MAKKRYTAATKNYDYKQDNGEAWWGVDGPVGSGFGLGYYSHALNPQLSMTTKEEAERAAEIADIAYRAGYEASQFEIQKALGLQGRLNRRSNG